jgi:hypothetical protein
MCGYELDSSGSGHDSMAGSCEHSDNTSGSIRSREFIHLLSDNQFLRKDSTAWSLLQRQQGTARQNGASNREEHVLLGSHERASDIALQ